MGVISILGTRRSEECSFKQKILSLSAFLSVGICALDILKKSIEKNTGISLDYQVWTKVNDS